MTAFDVVCVGESMALVTPDPAQPLSLGGPARLDAAGAESTVACYLAMLGSSAAWISRVGDDPLGELLRARISGYGVDTAHVEVDPQAPTGVFFKDPGRTTRVYYYRAGSAASRLGPGLRLPEARLVHLSGITPALSESCAALVDRILDDPAMCSFDVNYRPRLWPADRAGPALRRYADRADVVFVGLDEAQVLWGTARPDDVRDLLPSPGLLIVKDGGTGVTSYGPDGVSYEPAPEVEVVEPVGAGDAYAAGYLHGFLRDQPESARLRLGHLVAGAALRVTGDVATLPADLLARLKEA